MGNKHINTPNLDRLAAEGVAFHHAYCQSPVCTPSRASFLTGRYPRTTRCRQNGQMIPADEVMLPKMLRETGYDCGLSGKLHTAPCHQVVEERIDDGYRVFNWSHHQHPDWKENEYTQWHESRGYKWKDIYPGPQGRHAFPGVPSELHQTTWCFDKAMEFIGEKRDSPWLFSINCFDPHHPFDPPKEYLDRYDPDKLPDPDYVVGELKNKTIFQQVDHDGAYGGMLLAYSKMTPRERREVTAAYYAMVEHVDHNVGRILDYLDETGQRENTIVIFHSDHGELLGDHGIYLKGPFMYDCSVRVPLIISWPGHFQQGVKSDAMVELVDLVPTLLDASGTETPLGVQGKSLYGLLAGDADPHHHKDYVYNEYYIAQPFHRALEPDPLVTMVRTRTHKIAVFAGMKTGELYDLVADPGEHRNLWDSPKHQQLKLDMMKLCFDASVLTQDPLPERTNDW